MVGGDTMLKRVTVVLWVLALMRGWIIGPGFSRPRKRPRPM